MEFIANDFFEKWNYPCCIGALDGKHIAILQFQNSGSEYFNYKHFFSIVLLALVDANYKFVDINVGASVRAGDAGIYTDSDLKKALDEIPSTCQNQPQYMELLGRKYITT